MKMNKIWGWNELLFGSFPFGMMVREEVTLRGWGVVRKFLLIFYVQYARSVVMVVFPSRMGGA